MGDINDITLAFPDLDVIFSADEDCESFAYEAVRDRCQEYKNSGKADRKVTGLSLVDLNDDGF